MRIYIQFVHRVRYFITASSDECFYKMLSSFFISTQIFQIVYELRVLIF